tara:strand:- start:183 stop:398 length:216 start_codon:yes stop_codon:yes gene_type:complete
MLADMRSQQKNRCATTAGIQVHKVFTANKRGKAMEEQCKLCDDNALNHWRYAGMCVECYRIHREACDMLNQ